MLRKILRIAAKELTGYFSSPAAVLFLAAFLGVTLFMFFWVATFFERNLADVRPLFQWMPVLLIFLVAALTMRAWAEERRAGTLELLLTSPTAPTEHVLGKFLGCLALVLIALALTLALPITVSFLGPLDWGPVIGGYAAAIALAAAYVAIGLWVSCRTDNQIVSLILTVLIDRRASTSSAPMRSPLWSAIVPANGCTPRRGLALRLDHPRRARPARSVLLPLDHGSLPDAQPPVARDSCAGPAIARAPATGAGTGVAGLLAANAAGCESVARADRLGARGSDRRAGSTRYRMPPAAISASCRSRC